MAANQTYKPSEGKREEFRKYLEKTGVMDALTKVLVSLYEEPDKPNDALTYILNKLAVQCNGETVDSLKTRLQEANEKVEELRKENEALRGEEAPPPPPAAADDAPAEPPHPADADAPPAAAPADADKDKEKPPE